MAARRLLLIPVVGGAAVFWRAMASAGACTRCRDPAVGAPVLACCSPLLGVPGGILFNSIIRHHESQADAFGLEAAREPDGFAMTAMQLERISQDRTERAFEEMLFYDHPVGPDSRPDGDGVEGQHLAELPPEQRGMIVMKPPAS